jgi:hypothetical protein
LQVGDARALAQGERDLASAAGQGHEVRAVDLAQRQVVGHGQHDADAHDHALVGERVDGGRGRQASQHGQDAQCHGRQQHQPQAAPKGLEPRGSALQQHGEAPDQQAREVQAQQRQMEDAARHQRRARLPLPEDVLVRGKRLGQAGLSLELVFAPAPGRLVLAYRPHISGSRREGLAYSRPAPK